MGWPGVLVVQGAGDEVVKQFVRGHSAAGGGLLDEGGHPAGERGDDAPQLGGVAREQGQEGFRVLRDRGPDEREGGER